MTSQGQHNVRDESITSSLKEKNAEIISEKGISYMKINESKIRVDPDSSLPTIASKLFDESKKQKGAVKSIEKLMKKTEEKLEKTIEKGEIAKGGSYKTLTGENATGCTIYTEKIYSSQIERLD